MSRLRDAFAAHALQGLLAGTFANEFALIYARDSAEELGIDLDDYLAKIADELADAMMKRRP